MSISWRPIAAFVAVALSTSLVVAAVIVDDPLASPTNETVVRLREGARLDRASGWFKATIDRVEFHPATGGTKLICLENLALERVVDELENDLSLIWQIDGQVTEYHGRNYLLVERAFVKSTNDR